MNRDRLEGNWKQVKGKLKARWGRITDDQLDIIAGKRLHLVGVLQESYGIAKDEAERQIKEWEKESERLFGAGQVHDRVPRRKSG